MLTNLYKDALTGFDNLFALIMAETADLCGQEGTILYIDIKSLMHVNNHYSHEMGDLYIAACAECIKKEVPEQNGDGIHVFRISGDDFIVIFQRLRLEDICHIPESIDADLKVFALERSMDFLAGIHFVHWEYNTSPESPIALVREAYIRMQQEIFEAPLPSWVDHLINQMYRNIKDTLILLEKTSEEARIDTVSQIPNNKAASECLMKAQNEYALHAKPFSVLFIDGDNLRRYNESSYEHGNEMIRQLSKLIQSTIRENDSVFRWLSGDEFLVVLPGTTKEAAYKLAERIRATVSSSTASWEYPVTVSIGVSCFPTDGSTVQDVLRIAERSNSAAKREGKNRVC